MAMLEVKNIGISFGDLKTVDNFSLILEESELSGLIGLNGTGKATILSLLTGMHRPDKDSTCLDGRKLTDKSTIRTNQAGIAGALQNVRLLSNPLVFDNVKAGLRDHCLHATLEDVLRLSWFCVQKKEIDCRAAELLEVFHLEQPVDTRTKNLSYGSQREPEVACALAIESKLSLLDEPVADMNPNEMAELMETIQLVQKCFYVTIPLIEHDMKLVSGTCKRPTVLDFGKVLKQDETQEVLHDPEVVKVYLGE